ncbi:g4986 [Coccomyxa viridis]|uniref:G4986 protein n=1 Tax=Coccomyxa viridis TaxID=1274662 RepID=A0ABP1FRM7_9CHLO
MGGANSRPSNNGVLTKKELERMQRRIARLANGGSTVAIADMLQLPELSGNVLMEPILRLFDGDRDGNLTEAELIKAVQRLGELQQPDADPCLVIFQLYDTDGDGYVTSQDVLSLLRKTAAKALSENQLQLIVQATIAAHDKDGDGRLSRSEFRSLIAASQQENSSLSAKVA